MTVRYALGYVQPACWVSLCASSIGVHIACLFHPAAAVLKDQHGKIAQAAKWAVYGRTAGSQANLALMVGRA